MNDNDLPPLPKPDKQGNRPAIEFSRISLARDIIRFSPGGEVDATTFGKFGGHTAGNHFAN